MSKQINNDPGRDRRQRASSNSLFFTIGDESDWSPRSTASDAAPQVISTRRPSTDRSTSSTGRTSTGPTTTGRTTTGRTTTGPTTTGYTTTGRTTTGSTSAGRTTMAGTSAGRTSGGMEIQTIRWTPRNQEPEAKREPERRRAPEPERRRTAPVRRNVEPERTRTYGRREEEPVRTRSYGRSVEEPSGTRSYGRGEEEPVRTRSYGRSVEEPSRTRSYGRREEEPVRTRTYGRREEEPVRTRTYGRRETEPTRTASEVRRQSAANDTTRTRKKYGTTPQPQTEKTSIWPWAKKNITPQEEVKPATAPETKNVPDRPLLFWDMSPTQYREEPEVPEEKPKVEELFYEKEIPEDYFTTVREAEREGKHKDGEKVPVPAHPVIEITGETEPVEEPEPVAELPKLTQERSKTILEEPEPVAELPKPTREEAKPIVQEPKPVAEKAEPVKVKQKPIAEVKAEPKKEPEPIPRAITRQEPLPEKITEPEEEPFEIDLDFFEDVAPRRPKSSSFTFITIPRETPKQEPEEDISKMAAEDAAQIAEEVKKLGAKGEEALRTVRDKAKTWFGTAKVTFNEWESGISQKANELADQTKERLRKEAEARAERKAQMEAEAEAARIARMEAEAEAARLAQIAAEEEARLEQIAAEEEAARQAELEAEAEAARIAQLESEAEAARIAQQEAAEEAARQAQREAEAEAARIAQQEAAEEAARQAKLEAEAEAARQAKLEAEREAARQARMEEEREATHMRVVIFPDALEQTALRNTEEPEAGRTVAEPTENHIPDVTSDTSADTKKTTPETRSSLFNWKSIRLPGLFDSTKSQPADKMKTEEYREEDSKKDNKRNQQEPEISIMLAETREPVEEVSSVGIDISQEFDNLEPEPIAVIAPVDKEPEPRTTDSNPESAIRESDIRESAIKDSDLTKSEETAEADAIVATAAEEIAAEEPEEATAEEPQTAEAESGATAEPDTSFDSVVIPIPASGGTEDEEQPKKKGKRRKKKSNKGSRDSASDTREMEDEEKSPSRFNWRIPMMIVASIAMIVLGYYYAQGFMYYSKYFYDNTSIGTVNVSGMTAEQAENKIMALIDNYALDVNGFHVEDVIYPEDVGLDFELTDYDGKSKIEKTLKRQNAFLWPILSRMDHKLEALPHHFSNTKLDSAMNRIKCVNPKAYISAKNAFLELDEATHTYVIHEDEPANRADRAIVKKLVEDALNSWITEITLPEEAYTQARIRANDERLKKLQQETEKYMVTDITLEDGEKVVKIDRTVIPDFLIIDQNSYTVELDEEAVKHFINTTLDDTFDTLGRPRTVTTELSGTFTVSGGDYGKVVSTDEELPQLLEEIRKGMTLTREPFYRSDEISDQNGGIGYTYVDVNLSMQTLSYVSEGREIMTSYFVSGKTSDGHGTPEGTYSIQIKATEYTMVKYSAFVHYWMNFYPTEGVGFHDATWRSSFGGNIYKYSGSHGCINMPLSKAKELYGYISYGTPVVVHY